MKRNSCPISSLSKKDNKYLRGREKKLKKEKKKRVKELFLSLLGILGFYCKAFI